MANIHVSLAWMPVKALLAQGRAISAGTSRILDVMEEARLMLQRRVSPERVRRLPLFGCSRHPDAKPINKLQACQFRVSVRLISPGEHLISCAERVQREVGVSLHLGVVATAAIYRISIIFN
jgi:hypothetical protein